VLPKDLSGLTGDTALRVVLEVWLEMHMTNDMVRQYTHARAEFDWHEQHGATGVRWKLLKADANAIVQETAITLDGGSGASTRAVTAMVMPSVDLVAQSVAHGQLTFAFLEGAVGLDLFDVSNTPVFAHLLIKNKTIN
jgi:hypothetical protein